MAWISQNTSERLGTTDVLRSVNRWLARLPEWPLYVLGAIPVVYLYWRGLSGTLGIEPIEIIEHRLGLWGLWLLLAGLSVTPLRRIVGLNLMRFRRAIGLLAFFYILAHFLTWAVFDVQTLSAVWSDILKRPYITVGMLGFAGLVPLALTSWNGAIRRLGGRSWRRLHQLVYPAVLLGAFHFLMVGKGFQADAVLYLVATLGLLLLRIRFF